MRCLIAIALLLTLTGCIRDFRYPPPAEVVGRRVSYVYDDTIKGEAAAGWKSGPVVYYSQDFIDSPPHMQAYIIAHELCHIELKHLNPEVEIDELAADCCAMKKMYQTGHLPPEWQAKIIDEVMTWPQDPAHPSGAERSVTMMQCALEAPKE